MPALSAVLVIFSFQFSLLFFNISLTLYSPHQHCSELLVLLLIRNIAHRTLPKIWASTCLVRSVQGKDFEVILTVTWELDFP